MKISEILMDKYKLRIPPTVYYDLLSDVIEAEEEQESCDKCEVGNPCLYCKHEFESEEREDTDI